MAVTIPTRTGISAQGAIGSAAQQESPSLGADVASSVGVTSTNWTGNYAAGYTHTPGNTSALTIPVTIAATTAYAIEFVLSGRTAGQVEIAMGGASTTGGSGHKYPDIVDGVYATTTFQLGITTANNSTNLTFTPTSSFDGTIQIVSVKEVTGATPATRAIVNSNGDPVSEERSNEDGTGSTYFGYQTGQYALNGAIENSSFGYQSFATNTGGKKNTAIGYRALRLNTTGDANVAVGDAALQANTTGDQNTAVGAGAAKNVTSGFNNLAIGVESLNSLTTGDYNTAIGPYDTMYSLVTGNNNTAVGMLALFNHTGSDTTAVGNNALQANTSGAGNTGVGFYALNAVQTGNNNTALGYQAGVVATTSDNTLIGTNAGLRVAGTTGSNTALGSNALTFLTTGGYGTAIGAYSLFAATGRTNLGMGYGAGYNITTGRANIIVGNFVNAPSATVDGQINIGNVLFGLGAYDGGGSGTISNTPSATSAIGVGVAPTSTLTVAGSFAASSPTTVTGASHTVASTDAHIIANRAGTVTLTLPSASSFPGRQLSVRTIQAQTVVSNASNVVPVAGGSAGTAILAGVAGNWALLVSDGTSWQTQMAS